jgi:predicted 2-oxoglutarate/Fe(II)-dependent dioxygenase YbiX
MKINETLSEPIVFYEKIFYYESVLTNASIIVDMIESTNNILTEKDAINKWKKWTASDDEQYVFGYQKQTNFSKLQTSSEEVQFIYNTLWNLLENIGKDYSEKLNIEHVPPSPLSISKYIIGGAMGPHVDDYKQPGILPVMSGVVYLNDDVEGGELYFPRQNLKIKPKAGSVVVFPSVEPFVHESLPVTKGEKYMSPVFWVKRD